MSKITTKSVYDNPATVTFNSRIPMRDIVRNGIRRAQVMSSAARLSGRHDFGLDKSVVFTHPDDYRFVARQEAEIVIVCSDVNNEGILYLVPHRTENVYQCLVANGLMVREFLSIFLSPRYLDLAYDEAKNWRESFSVEGFRILIADHDGEFAGLLVDGHHLKTSNSYIDTSSRALLDVAGSRLSGEPIEIGEQEVAAFIRAFEAEQFNSVEVA